MMAKFYLHDITNIDPMAIESHKWEKLFLNMQSRGWSGTPGYRMGIARSARFANMIGGFFANEGRKRAIQYDEKKEEIEPSPFFSFEHLFFVIFLDTAQILIQSRNIYDYVDLTLGTIRSNLLLHLTDLFRLSDIYVPGERLDIEDAGIIFSYEELYLTFRNLPIVTELEVIDLFGATLPERGDPKYRLFNPKEDWEPITWGAVADTLKMGLDSVKMTTIEDPNATLKAPIPKALAATGKIQKIRGADSEGRVTFRQHTKDTELVIDLPIGYEVSVELLGKIVENLDAKGRVPIWNDKRNRRRAKSDQDLFRE
jgi:hypothetical protein